MAAENDGPTKAKKKLFHSTKKGLQILIVFKNLAKETGLPFVQLVQKILVLDMVEKMTSKGTLKL